MNPNRRTDWPAAFQELRAIVDYEAAHAPASVSACKICTNCGQPVRLTTGKRAGLSWFVHDNVSDCYYDDYRARIMFESRDVAMRAETIFDL